MFGKLLYRTPQKNFIKENTDYFRKIYKACVVPNLQTMFEEQTKVSKVKK